MGEVVSEVTRTDENSSAPVMMITANDGFIYQAERYSTDNAGESLKKYILLEKGELAYNHGASKLRPYGSCFALTTETIARVPFVYHCFSTSTENPEFLSCVLNSKVVERQLRKLISSGARMDGLLNISFEEYTSIKIRIPSRDEQDKIAVYFRKLDMAITLHQRKKKVLKKYKLE
ncbi:MAG: restriction endonuclease subunit S [Lachnospiraceae bacterium]|nr:restriction endonuclease subunit S [Lachnospiraceae bacterium]